MKKLTPILIIGAIVLIAVVINVVWFFSDSRSKEEEPSNQPPAEIDTFEEWNQELESAKDQYSQELEVLE